MAGWGLLTGWLPGWVPGWMPGWVSGWGQFNCQTTRQIPTSTAGVVSAGVVSGCFSFIFQGKVTIRKQPPLFGSRLVGQELCSGWVAWITFLGWLATCLAAWLAGSWWSDLCPGDCPVS